MKLVTLDVLQRDNLHWTLTGIWMKCVHMEKIYVLPFPLQKVAICMCSSYCILKINGTYKWDITMSI